MSKKTFTKVFAIKPLAMVIATLLASHALHAQPMNSSSLYGNSDMTRYETNNAEFGLGYQNSSGSDYRANEWGGMSDHVFGIGHLNISSRKDNGVNYTIRGRNLGLDSRRFGVDGGRQGNWKLKFQYGQITHRNTEGSFIYDGLGSNNLTLPSGFPSLGNLQPHQGTNPATFQTYAHNYGIKTDRQTVNLGGEYKLNSAWGITANYRYDRREGTNLIGAVLGSGGGSTTRSMIAPYPINENTHQIDLGASFVSDKAQFNVTYLYSKFINDDDTLTWQSYSTAVGAPGRFPNGRGRLDLAPDNYFHQIKADGGYNITPKTRVTTAFQYGMARQNQRFTPYTINSQAINTPLPVESLNGKVDSTMFDLSLNTREINRLNLKFKYHYTDEKNKTAQNWYSYIQGDVSTTQIPIPPGTDPNTLTGGTIRTNPIYSTTKHSFLLDADYQIFRRNSLRGWYQHTKASFSPEEHMTRAKTNTNQYGVEWRTRSFDMVTGKLQYVYEQRRGNDYDRRRGYANSHTEAATAAANPSGANNVRMRQFNIADYNQNKVKASVDITPNDLLSVQLSADWAKRNYRGPDCGNTSATDCIGLKSTDRMSYTIDAQYALPSNINLFAFYTYAQYKTDQDGTNWSQAIKNKDDTFGLGVNWKPRAKPYEMGIQYLYNKGVGQIDSSTTTATVLRPLPDTKYLLNNIDLYGKWTFNKNFALRVNYNWQKMQAEDWAYDNIDPWTMNNVLFTGQTSGSYTRHALGLSLLYSW